MAIEVTSTAFAHGQPIPKQYSGEGADVSPPISWSGLPEGTQELVLICDDPDAPTAEPWVHWVIYKIPITLTELPEGIERRARLKQPAGVLQGKQCTAYPAVGPDVTIAGGEYQAIPVDKAHVDGNLVTAPAWPAHPDWLAKFLTVLGAKIEL